ncbi:hypothetical protein BH11MYX3_BH11MYX3_09510 [soil metagenome]
MGVFPIAAGAELFRAAAIAAAYELGVFDVLPRSRDALAAAIGIANGSHRVRALVDALVQAGVLVRDGAVIVRGEVPPRPEVVREGWGRLAEVIQSDRPLPLDDDPTAYHRHLVRAGAETARELAPVLVASSLLDLGGGAGTYTEAFLDAHPDARATIVDAAEILVLARDHLARFAERVRYLAGDARTVALGEAHGVVLLANVLHLHGRPACAALCMAAARSVAPGGTVAILDLRADSLEGIWFALDMAIYTERGDVHASDAVRGWLVDAGLIDIAEHRLPSTPEIAVVTGRRPL